MTSGMNKNLFAYIWQHSWRDQLLIFAVVIISLPFFFMSLDLPKRIVNDAIQGRAFKDGQPLVNVAEFTLTFPSWISDVKYHVSDGFKLDQMQFLLYLSSIFLFFVLINGAFKYWINVAKGALGERMLRRMRFDLVALLLRFTPATLRTVKSSEMATIVKDEVEPIGGFIGDAFAQPLILITQAATAMIFILIQSLWLGLLAGGVVVIQLIVIPLLRREQLRLGKERQVASRKLAGRVGEIVDGIEAIHIHDARRWERADISHRLYTLFDLRFRLFKRKFVVKYLNNMLAQVTPFLFYSIGGYFALTGRLDIGQLVAVIGAYRELPPPLKELIDWDQQRLDVQIKYDQVVQQFTPDELLQIEDDIDDAAVPLKDISGTRLSISNLRISDPQGGFIIEHLSFDAELPALVGVFGEGAGASALARVLARVDTATGGQILLAGEDIIKIPQHIFRRRLAYVSSEATLFPASLRENLLYGVRRPPRVVDEADTFERKRRLEAKRTGNPADDPRADWTDYSCLGSEDAAEIDRLLLDALELTGMRRDVYRFGLSGRIGMTIDTEMQDKIVTARQALRDVLADQNMLRLIEPFDPERYNTQSTIAENILFGVPVDGVASHRFIENKTFRRALADTALLPELERLGEKIAMTMTEIFRGVPPGHSLFEQFSFIAADELDEFEDILRRRGTRDLTAGDRHRLVLLTLGYVEPRHRLGLINTDMASKILAARKRFREICEQAKGGSGNSKTDYTVEFYDPASVCSAAPLRDNLLFGRVAFGTADAETRVTAALTQVVDDLGLREDVERIGLTHQAGPAGRMLTPQQRARISLARCLIKKPDILIFDNALAVLGDAEAGRVLARVAETCKGRSLLVVGRLAPPDIVFNVTVTFDGMRAKVQHQGQAHKPDQPAKTETAS
jgi:putative ABC transport system ATP-binding protein